MRTQIRVVSSAFCVWALLFLFYSVERADAENGTDKEPPALRSSTQARRAAWERMVEDLHLEGVWVARGIIIGLAAVVGAGMSHTANEKESALSWFNGLVDDDGESDLLEGAGRASRYRAEDSSKKPRRRFSEERVRRRRTLRLIIRRRKFRRRSIIRDFEGRRSGRDPYRTPTWEHSRQPPVVGGDSGIRQGLSDMGGLYQEGGHQTRAMRTFKKDRRSHVEREQSQNRQRETAEEGEEGALPTEELQPQQPPKQDQSRKKWDSESTVGLRQRDLKSVDTPA